MFRTCLQLHYTKYQPALPKQTTSSKSCDQHVHMLSQFDIVLQDCSMHLKCLTLLLLLASPRLYSTPHARAGSGINYLPQSQVHISMTALVTQMWLLTAELTAAAPVMPIATYMPAFLAVYSTSDPAAIADCCCTHILAWRPVLTSSPDCCTLDCKLLHDCCHCTDCTYKLIATPFHSVCLNCLHRLMLVVCCTVESSDACVCVGVSESQHSIQSLHAAQYCDYMPPTEQHA